MHTIKSWLTILCSFTHTIKLDGLSVMIMKMSALGLNCNHGCVKLLFVCSYKHKFMARVTIVI
jgi:hypothetical protein